MQISVANGTHCLSLVALASQIDFYYAARMSSLLEIPFCYFSSDTMFDKWIIWKRNKRYIAAEQRECRREKAKNLRFLSQSSLTFASFPFV